MKTKSSSARPSAGSARLAVIIPAFNEEECIGPVLDELLGAIDLEKFDVVVGVNSSTDRTAQIAREFPVLVAETGRRGYGHGCQAAIELVNRALPQTQGYIFFAADGASDPRDVAQLADAYAQGYPLVLGTRTKRLRNWPIMTFSHVIANFGLALWCGLLTGRWFTDLGPLRLIDRELFEQLALREMTFGWTIEAQIGAARFGVPSREITVSERRRIAGQQKVSGVTWRRTFSIGCRIVAAGWRARARYSVGLTAAQPITRLVPQA